MLSCLCFLIPVLCCVPYYTLNKPFLYSSGFPPLFLYLLWQQIAVHSALVHFPSQQTVIDSHSLNASICQVCDGEKSCLSCVVNCNTLLYMTLTVTCTTKIVNMTTFQQNYTASTCTHEIFQICKFMVQCSVFTFFTCPGTAHLPATWRQCTKYVQQPVFGPLLLLLLLVHQLAA